MWLVSGHGAQRPQKVIEKDVNFRRMVENLDEIIVLKAGFSPIAVLSTPNFDNSDKVQVLTYVMQIALVSSLDVKGSRPGAIIGYSVGGGAAPVAAGALSLVEGALVVCRQARLYRQVMGRGALRLVNQAFADMAAKFKGRSNAVATIEFSPTFRVVSGAVEAIYQLESVFQARGVKTFRIQSGIAIYSSLLDSLAKSLRVLSARCYIVEPLTQLYSTADADPRQVSPRDTSYWVRNTLHLVLLSEPIRAAVKGGFKLFLEVFSHPIISLSVNETLTSLDALVALVAPTLPCNKPSRVTMMKAFAKLWCEGAPIDFGAAFAGLRWTTDLPKTK